MTRPRNSKALAIGRDTTRGFAIRRIVWGRLLARLERRDGEKIKSVEIVLINTKGNANGEECR